MAGVFFWTVRQCSGRGFRAGRQKKRPLRALIPARLLAPGVSATPRRQKPPETEPRDTARRPPRSPDLVRFGSHGRYVAAGVRGRAKDVLSVIVPAPKSGSHRPALARREAAVYTPAQCPGRTSPPETQAALVLAGGALAAEGTTPQQFFLLPRTQGGFFCRVCFFFGPTISVPDLYSPPLVGRWERRRLDQTFDKVESRRPTPVRDSRSDDKPGGRNPRIEPIKEPGCELGRAGAQPGGGGAGLRRRPLCRLTYGRVASGLVRLGLDGPPALFLGWAARLC